jgi:hypothetical protein
MPALVAPREDRAVDAAPRSEDDVKAAVGRFAVGRIIRFAILEGGCFLNLVVYLLDHSLLSLVVAGIGLFLLMLSFPTAWAMRRAL